MPDVLCASFKPLKSMRGLTGPSTLSQIIIHLKLIMPWILSKANTCVSYVYFKRISPAAMLRGEGKKQDRNRN